MPGAHRDQDSRRCGGKTTVINQSSVFVNGRLWSVVGDHCTHQRGDLVAIYGPPSVLIEGKYVICAVGDTAKPDLEGHPPGEDDPEEASDNVFVYS